MPTPLNTTQHSHTTHTHLLLGLTEIHDDHEITLDRKIYIRPTHVQNLDSIKSS